jgi:hypothetical protein
VDAFPAVLSPSQLLMVTMISSRTMSSCDGNVRQGEVTAAQRLGSFQEATTKYYNHLQLWMTILNDLDISQVLHYIAKIYKNL